MPPIDRPIFIIGAARSGTTLLSKFFLNHPDVFYASEPNAVWKHGHFNSNHDVLLRRHADPATRDYIRNYFSKQLRQNQKVRLVEKTPTNCLRISFIHEIFPDAKFVHIIRDGRDVALSSYKKRQGNIQQMSSISQPTDKGRIENVIKTFRKHLNQQELSLNHLMHLFPHYMRATLNVLNIRDYKMWGPKFVGMKECTTFYTQRELAALQWKQCVETVVNYFEANGVVHHCIKYENLLSNPQKEVARMFDFCGLNVDETTAQAINKHIGNRQQAISNAHRSDSDIDSLIYSTLKLLGYK